jgi:aryl-alcohol dehydrogenase-like predicted oxidoreductase/predicted kinase
VARVGIGCMRLSTDADRDDARALATLLRAIDDGVSWLDTAHAYGHDDSERGHNERLVGRALEARPSATPRIVTKCGMTRPNGGWEPDGRASTIREDARASAAALGRPADVLLLHAPDRAVPLATSLRALLRAMDDGHARAIGLSNVSRGQLDALATVTSSIPLAAVEVGLGAYEDAPARGGVVAWCKERGVPLLAHAPLGGPTRVSRLARDSVLRAIAQRHAATPAAIVLAYLLAVDASIVPIVGVRRPETATSALAAERIVLDEHDLAALDGRFPGLALVRCPPRRPSASEGCAEVVIVMGLAGSGKTRLAESFVERGYERLNRDSLGGTLRGIAQKLERRLGDGAKRVVLDNTYVSRASRSEVVRVAHTAGASVRCIHVDTPSHELQMNCARRMFERHGELLGGMDLARHAKMDPNLFAPHALFRMARQLERPSEDEGFASIETHSFVREHDGEGAALVVPMELVLDARADRDVVPRSDAPRILAGGDVPVLLYGWWPGADATWQLGAAKVVSELAREVLGLRPNHPAASAAPTLVQVLRPIELAICSHASGPPVCWCRPPLPGLWVPFARRHRIDPRKSTLLTMTSAHRSMARALGLVDVSVSENSHGPRSEVE